MITASGANLAFIALACVLLLATASRVAAGTPLDRVGAGFIAASPPVAAFNAARESWGRATDSVQSGHARRSLPAIRGSLIALPIIIVLWLLLASADPHLESWGAAIKKAIEQLEFVPRLLFGVAVLVLVFGSYGLARRDTTPPAEAAPAKRPLTLGAAERTIVLGAVAALFALFAALQLTTSAGDPAAIAGSGVTYAEWARRGFGELATAAALVTLLIVLLDALAERGDEPVERRVRSIAIVLIALTLLVTASALRRVLLYEAAYGYTVMRIQSQAFMIGVGVALFLLSLELRGAIDNRRFARRAGVTAALIVAALTYWNHEAFIVRRNIEHFAGTGKLDVRYLSVLLSPDGLPTLLAARPALSPKEDSLLTACLAWRLDNDRGHELTAGRWFEYNIRRRAAVAALDAARPLGDPAGCGFSSD